MTSRYILQKFRSEFEDLIGRTVKELGESDTFSADEIRDIWEDFEDGIDSGRLILAEEMSPIVDDAERREDGDLI